MLCVEKRGRGRRFPMTYSFLMLAESSINDTNVEENLAGLGNLLEFEDSIIKFIVVITTQG